MSMFLTRVELHKADYFDYEKLHTQMRKNGFKQTIDSSNGTYYHLPTAEYYHEGNFTADAVLQSAKSAAQTTGKLFAIIVSETTTFKWDGLAKV